VDSVLEFDERSSGVADVLTPTFTRRMGTEDLCVISINALFGLTITWFFVTPQAWRYWPGGFEGPGWRSCTRFASTLESYFL
jgi:hypothetical protein